MLRDSPEGGAIVIAPAGRPLRGSTQALPVGAPGVDRAVRVASALGSAVVGALRVRDAVLRRPVRRSRTIVIAEAGGAIGARQARGARRPVSRFVRRHVRRLVHRRAPPAARAVGVEGATEDRAERVGVGWIYAVAGELIGGVARRISLSPARKACSAPLTRPLADLVRAEDAEALGRIVVAGPVEGTIGRARAGLMTRRSGAGSVVDALVSGRTSGPATRGGRAARRAAKGRREREREGPGDGARNGALAKCERMGHGR